MKPAASGAAPEQARARLGDAELVARCREGSEEAWAELVERFSAYVYGIVVQGFRLSQHDAEDVFQEVFTRTYEKLDDLRDDAAIRPYIAQLARRCAIDRHRAAARVEPTDDAAEMLGADEEPFARLDEAMTVHEAIGVLPDHCREVLLRFFARDESYRTIGEALELPAGTIASRISRCLAKLRTELEEGNAAPDRLGRE
jgi:RNA polymerase sigma-70 factor (ECF subfamily)